MGLNCMDCEKALKMDFKCQAGTCGHGKHCDCHKDSVLEVEI